MAKIAILVDLCGNIDTATTDSNDVQVAVVYDYEDGCNHSKFIDVVLDADITEENFQFVRSLGSDITEEEVTAAAKVLEAYINCEPDLQEAAADMLHIINDPDEQQDQKDLATHTLMELLR